MARERVHTAADSSPGRDRYYHDRLPRPNIGVPETESVRDLTIGILKTWARHGDPGIRIRAAIVRSRKNSIPSDSPIPTPPTTGRFE